MGSSREECQARPRSLRSILVTAQPNLTLESDAVDMDAGSLAGLHPAKVRSGKIAARGVSEPSLQRVAPLLQRDRKFYGSGVRRSGRADRRPAIYAQTR